MTTSGKTGWQPIETAPKDGTDILVWGHDLARVANWVPERNAFCVNAHSFVAMAPTHWMPLPPPPVSE